MGGGEKRGKCAMMAIIRYTAKFQQHDCIIGDRVCGKWRRIMGRRFDSVI